jgi:orotidine-5'-phosphate decarboxylase
MSKIIVALDDMLFTDMVRLTMLLKDHIWGVKINDALVRHGSLLISQLKSCGAQHVMADPKFYDIPNTVKNGVKTLTEAGATFITVHAQAGVDVLKAAKEAAGDKAKILAITVLTSDSQDHRQYEVRKRAYVAQSAGCDGIVCAAPDLDDIKDINLMKVVPGIRPGGKVAGDDQVHVSSMIPPLADFVVVGRPITQASDPLAVVKSLG